jgi:hypothetical protein
MGYRLRMSGEIYDWLQDLRTADGPGQAGQPDRPASCGSCKAAP